MNEFCFVLMTFVVLLALVIVLITILKNGKFTFLLKKDKKKDVLLVETEHQTTDLDDWYSGASAPIFLT